MSIEFEVTGLMPQQYTMGTGFYFPELHLVWEAHSFSNEIVWERKVKISLICNISMCLIFFLFLLNRARISTFVIWSIIFYFKLYMDRFWKSYNLYPTLTIEYFNVESLGPCSLGNLPNILKVKAGVPEVTSIPTLTFLWAYCHRFVSLN